MPVGGACWFHSVARRGGAGAGPEAGYHGRARRRLYRLPRRAGPRRVRWLLSASGRQAPGIPLPPAAELPRRPAAVPAHVHLLAGLPDDYLREIAAYFADQHVPYPAAVRPRFPPRSWRPAASLPRTATPPRPAGMRRLSMAPRWAGYCRACPACWACRATTSAPRSAAGRTGCGARPSPTAWRTGRQADAGGHQRAGGLAVVAAGARVLRRRTGGFARCPPSAAARRGVEGRP